MRQSLVLAAATLALASCNQKEDQAAKPAGQVAAAKADMPQPGMYRTTVKVLEVNMPGLPAGHQGMVQNMFGKAGKTMESCLTKADAEKGYEELSKRAAEGDCKRENFSAAGGKIAAKMVCQTGQGMTATTELTGTYSPTSSSLQMSTRSDVPGVPGGAMTMKAEMTQERIGDC